ncbi:adhesion G protein-coupled receptor L4 isoform X2 [Salmo salar]|uniref:Adhesion G protein-coupled receptor L4 isoform X2 n=1 Tax=Salmo salar TaxID=8030 RepID=A0ABM3EY61_SALSA|nr:adhesion G protein-coupled receptor L4 isoform X2 [Salmo salar]
MTGRVHLLILALHLAPLMVHVSACPPGFSTKGKDCIDINECLEKATCGPNAECHNVLGSYSCICNEGFVSNTGVERFIFGQGVTCKDENECNPPSDDYNDDPETPQICGENAACINTEGSFYCQCAPGFRSSSQRMTF